MKYFLVLGLCLVISSLAAGHGYGRTRTQNVKPVYSHKPVIQPKPVIHPKPVFQPKPVIHHPKPVIHHPKPVINHPKPVFNHPKPVINHPKPVIHHPKPINNHPKPVIQPLPLPGQGGPFNPMGMEALPAAIQAIIGSTIHGMPIRGGMEGWPEHGGSGTDPSGLRNGWGADPNAPMLPGGMANPVNSAAHGGQMVGGFDQFDQFRQTEHNIMKESNHVAAKTISGISPIRGVGPVAGVGRVGVAPVASPVHNMIKTENHIAMKSGVISAGKPSYLSERPMMNPAAAMAHNIGKATMGAGPMIDPHMTAKSSIGVNPIGHNMAHAEHNMVKSTVGGSFGRPINNPHMAAKSNIGVNPIGHNMARASVGGHMGIVPQVNPVQAVHEVSKSGIAAIGHDRLAANIGHNVAKQVITEAARVVDIGSGGGVSMNNPVAVAATHGLAQEATHVAGKTLRVASQTNPNHHAGSVGVFGGMHHQSVHPKPVVHHPKPVVRKPINAFPTGYGRRRY